MQAKDAPITTIHLLIGAKQQTALAALARLAAEQTMWLALMYTPRPVLWSLEFVTSAAEDVGFAATVTVIPVCVDRGEVSKATSTNAALHLGPTAPLFARLVHLKRGFGN